MSIRHCAVVLTAVLTAVVLAALAAAPADAEGAPNQQDQAFLVAAHQSNLAEIAAGQAAQSKAALASTRDLGVRFVNDHSRLDGSLTTVAARLGVSLPVTPSAEQQSMLAQVSANTGEAFDRAWLAMEIAGHRQTLAAIQTELRSGSSEQVKQLAQSALPVVQEHLNLLLAANGGAAAGVNTGTGGQAAQPPLWSAALGVGILIAGVGLFGLGLVGLARPQLR